MTFTVLEKDLIPEQSQQDEEEIIFEQYEEGLISESEFEKRLAEIGYDPEEIRQAKALIGKLEHQEGFQAPLKGPIKVQGTEFEITYVISGGLIKEVVPDEEGKALIVQIESVSNGTLSIKLPREVIDAKVNDLDDNFFVILDGEEVGFEETRTGHDRTITFDYPNGSKELVIIGTSVIPEFGTIAILILMVSIFSLIFISKSKFGLIPKL